MTDLELLKLAKEAGLILTAERETPGWSAPLPGATYPDRLERFATLHRAQVLDEAARACKDVSSNSGSEQYNIFGKDLAEQCADAIRALKGETKSGA